MTDLTQAHITRSIRTITAELEFLRDCNAITATQLHDLLARLPAQTPGPPAPTTTTTTPQPPPPKQQPQPALPVRTPSSSTPSALCSATALYAYPASDDGDLALQPGDRVAVTEYVNAEWWKGRAEQSGAEGIFPRSYVRVEEEAPAAAGPAWKGSQQVGLGFFCADGFLVRPCHVVALLLLLCLCWRSASGMLDADARMCAGKRVVPEAGRCRDPRRRQCHGTQHGPQDVLGRCGSHGCGIVTCTL